MSAWIDRRALLAGMTALGCAPALSRMPRLQRMPRIGYMVGAGAGNDTLAAAFERELARLGYVHGQSIHIEYRRPRFETTDRERHAAELAQLGLDLVVVGALPFALAMREAAPALLMVVSICPGIVSNGLARSMEKPGGLVTGIDELPPELIARRMSLLKSVAPGATRLALISTTPGRGGHEIQLADAERAAPKLGMTVHPYRATTTAELDEALAAIARDGMNGLLSFQGAVALANRQRIVDFAARQRLPGIYQSGWFVDSGGLMSWAPDLPETFAKAAHYVDRILRGAWPGDLPIQHPSPYYLRINTAAARELGIEVPQNLLEDAARRPGLNVGSKPIFPGT